MSTNTITQLRTVKGNTASKVANELSRTGGLLRLAPAWVPRFFLQPGLRIKLHPDDTYAYGLNRGGIDERWFASTTEGYVFNERGCEAVIIPPGRPMIKDCADDKSGCPSPSER